MVEGLAESPEEEDLPADKFRPQFHRPVSMPEGNMCIAPATNVSASGCPSSPKLSSRDVDDYAADRPCSPASATSTSSPNSLSSSSSSSSSSISTCVKRAAAAGSAASASSRHGGCSPSSERRGLGSRARKSDRREGALQPKRKFSWMWVAFQYMRLVRFYNHTNYLIVVLAATAFGGGGGGEKKSIMELFVDLFVLYLTFNIGLYGGIYSLNAVTDAEEDRRLPAKSDRPIPSGAVSIPGACLFVFLLWSFAFIGAHFYFDDTKILLYFVAFIVVNLAYSLHLKHWKFCRFTSAALTTPLRMYMGGQLRGAEIPFMAALVGYCFMASVQSTKVRREKRKELEIVNGWPPFYLEALSMATIGFGCVTLHNEHYTFVYPVIIAVTLFLGGSTLSREVASVLLGADIKAKYTVVDVPVDDGPSCRESTKTH